MLPLRSVPPSNAPPLMEIRKTSVVPASPLSSTYTVNVQAADELFSLQVPLKVAVFPLTVNDVNDVAFSLIPAPGLL
jgi:hypothetical protein